MERLQDAAMAEKDEIVVSFNLSDFLTVDQKEIDPNEHIEVPDHILRQIQLDLEPNVQNHLQMQL